MYAICINDDDIEQTVEVLESKTQSDGRVLYKIQFIDGWRRGVIIYVDQHQIEIDYST